MRLALLAAAQLAAACAAPDPAGLAALARGRRVAERFCYACHDRETDRARNPLLPRLDLARFGTPALAYASVGRLEQLSAGMTLPFEGPEEDRRALAAWLADAAQRGAAGRRRASLAIALGAAAAVAAALAAARARARRRR